MKWIDPKHLGFVCEFGGEGGEVRDLGGEKQREK
jgi:hypothetical protein